MCGGECCSRYNVNSACDFVKRMRLLVKTGLLVLLITSVIGRAIEDETVRNFNNSTNINEEPLENNCNCEWRFYKHYEAKGCQVVQVDSCGCPKKYLCPLFSYTDGEQKTCVYQNEEYKLGSRISVQDKCQFCRCLGDETPQIVCRTKNCPQLEAVEKGNCHLVYEKDQCCPSKYECVFSSVENEALEMSSFCVHDRITYPLGAKIYPKDDPCLVCECTENWSGIGNSSCYRQDCLWEKNKKRLDEGCIPIYHENKCCPIEFHCPERQNANLSTKFLAEEISDHVGSCTFGSDSFEIGSELSLSNPCIKCNCVVPPDFTCVHQSCPSAPPVENCEVVYSTDECCSSYKCFYEDSISDFEIPCPTPICGDASCVVKTPENHRCPTCVCDEITHEKNALESNDDPTMEGPRPIDEPFEEEPFINGTEPEDTEFETENSDAEILNPNEMEFSDGNKNMSDRFMDSSSEKDRVEYDEIEKLEHEIEETAIFEKGKDEPFENGEVSLNEREEFIGNGDFQISSESTNLETAPRVLRKRSNDFRNNNGLNQGQQQYNQQQQFFEEDTDTGREIDEDSEEGFDELKLSSRNRNSEENGESNTDNDDLNSSESVAVPAGCPTPLCANSTCRIEIPVGHRCPTCICKRRENWQP